MLVEVKVESDVLRNSDLSPRREYPIKRVPTITKDTSVIGGLTINQQ